MEYITYWKRHKVGKEQQESKFLYLKDWHFVRCRATHNKHTPTLSLIPSTLLQGVWDEGHLHSPGDVWLRLAK